MARPLDFANYTPEQESFYYGLLAHLIGHGHTVYDPGAGWHVRGPIDVKLARTIEGTNRQALRRSDVVVAWLPDGVQTQGVPMEIEAATHQIGIPCIVVGRVGVSLTANSLVSVLDETDVAKVARQIELVQIGAPQPDSLITYSAPEGVELKPAHHNDAGIDLAASEEVVVVPRETALIPTGVRVSLVTHSFAWVVARSSTYGQYGLIVLPGVIDETYQGELFVNTLNSTPYPVRVHKGDRIAQLLLLHNMWAGYGLQKVDEDRVFPFVSTRGDRGFGSSGR